jgi:lysophospholipase L1-like esterase
MKSILFLSACACLILPFAGIAAGPSTMKPVTIMPLGDSITEGGEGFVVYRYPLMDKLQKAGYNVAYVGSKTTQAVAGSPLGVLHHEGYAGQNIAFIKNRFAELYRANPADIILLHAGHNQFADQHPIPGMLKDTRDIITTARSINPKVTILLGQVITSGKLPKYSYIPDYNQALVALATELNTAKQPVILVNQADGFNWQTDTIGDKVHPNAHGAEKMAARWFEALTKILPSPAKK